MLFNMIHSLYIQGKWHKTDNACKHVNQHWICAIIQSFFNTLVQYIPINIPIITSLYLWNYVPLNNRSTHFQYYYWDLLCGALTPSIINSYITPLMISCLVICCLGQVKGVSRIIGQIISGSSKGHGRLVDNQNRHDQIWFR